MVLVPFAKKQIIINISKSSYLIFCKNATSVKYEKTSKKIIILMIKKNKLID